MSDIGSPLGGPIVPTQSAVPQSPVSSGKSLLRVMTNSEIDAEEKSKEVVIIDEEATLSEFARKIREDWRRAWECKQPIDEIHMRNLRQVEGKYDPDHEQAIKATKGSDVFVMLTAQKCRDAESFIRDILDQAGDKTWSLEAQPISELPGDIAEKIAEKVATAVVAEVSQAQAGVDMAHDPKMFYKALGAKMAETQDAVKALLHAEAQRRAEAMEKKIVTQCDTGNWDKALASVIIDLTRFKACILKGPVPRRRRSLKWVNAPDGSWKVDPTPTVHLDFERVDPFNFFPLAGAIDIQRDGCIELHRLTRQDLEEMKGLAGYNDVEINATLEDYGAGGLKNWTWQTLKTDEDSAKDLGTTNVFYSSLIDALQYWGSVSGRMLREWGMSSKDVPDENRDYQVEAWLIGSHIIKCVLNPDPLGRKPYSVTGFFKEPDCIWHKSLPETIRPPQTLCNATARAIGNNAAAGSGPMFEVNTDLCNVGTNVYSIYPFKVFPRHTEQGQADGEAVRVIEVPTVVEELLVVYKHFKAEADELSGIPSYTHVDTANAGQTASGLSMLMSADAKTVKLLLDNVDDDIVKPTISRVVAFNMIFDEDQSIKGDVNVKVSGIHALVAKEQLALRSKEFLRDTNNPIDLEIMGMEGRANAMRVVLRRMDIDPDELIKGMTSQPNQQQQMPPVSPTPGAAGVNPSPGGPIAPGQSAGTPSPGMSAPGGTPEIGAPTLPGGTPMGGEENRTFGNEGV